MEGREPDIVIKRRLHPVLSELGEIDKASQTEFQKDRVFEYHVFEESNCLVETDEEPPRPLNRDALNTALELAMHLNAKPVDEVHVMRKIVIDGSNTSGFQRTAVIALEGFLETSKGKVGITQIALEEESAGIVKTEGNKVIYRLDRLGIPLVEITTDPDIKDGEHLREVAEKIGMILRATGKVARGIGTIRQDVNISEEGGARVEIKGVQDLRMLSKMVLNEVKRQSELIKLKDELKAKFNGKIYLPNSFFDVTDLFKGTASKLISRGIKSGNSVLAAKLTHHKGFLGKELQPGKRYGTELSDYAKTAGVGGIIHSDEILEKYSISDKEVSSLRKTLNMKDDDAFVLVIAEKKKANNALEMAIKRAEMDFVPEQTRKPNPDGTTSYMRPLPGRARMYPETDVPSVEISADVLRSAKEGMGESLEKKKEKLLKILNPEMAEKILKSKHLKTFEKLLKSGADSMLLAVTIENTLISLRREGFDIKDVEKTLTELFKEFKKGKFVKAAIPEVLKGMSKGMSASESVKENNLEKITGKELSKIAKEYNYEMHKIMQKYRLRIDPADILKLRK